MNCPKCGNNTNTNRCPSCDIDIKEYIFVDKMSFDAYNAGLLYAKNNEIQKAIRELTKAVSYNSENITALNLLGVCYDRIGRIADASKYWIRSCLVIDENIAQNYLKKVEEKASKRERLNDSIKCYNQALVYIRQKSDDMALIQLKKAIELNGNFTEAMNLIGLLYIKNGETDKAINILKNVLLIDVSDEKALSYLSELNYNPQKNISKKVKEKKPENVISKSKTAQNRNRSIINRDSLMGFGVSLVIMLFIIIFLIIPNIKTGFTISSQETEKSYKDQIEQQNILLSSKDTEIANLKSENERLKTENQTITDDYNLLNVNLALINAAEYISAKDYSQAALEIQKIAPDALKPEQIDEYNSLKNQAYPLASKTYYDNGVKKYDAKAYKEALSFFELSIEFGGTDKVYYPNTLFYIGRCYEGLGEVEQAKVYYQKLIDEYPNNDSVYSAKSRLNTIS